MKTETTTKPQGKGSKAASDVAALLRARNPLLWIVTKEEARAERYLVEACERARYIPSFWDCGDGISNYDGSEAFPNSARVVDPAAALQAIAKQTFNEGENRRVFIMRDLANKFLDDPFVSRKLRNAARNEDSVDGGSQRPEHRPRRLGTVDPALDGAVSGERQFSNGIEAPPVRASMPGSVSRRFL